MDADHRKSSAHIVAGVKWSYLGAALRLLAQLGIAAVLARLLTPAEFGVVALGLVVIRFAKYFADMGVVGAIVQARELDQQDIGAAFAIASGLGLVFSVIVVACAQFAASFYEMPELEPVLQWLAVGFVISGLSITAQGLLRRAVNFKYISLADIISYVIGYGAVGIGMAAAGFGVHALVGAFLAQSLIQMILLYARVRHTLRIPTTARPYRGLLAYGSGYSLANFLTFLASNLDHLVIGKFFPPVALGVYNRAKYLVSLPTYQMLISLTQVLFPSYAGSQDDPARLRSLFMNGMLIVGLLLLPASIGMVAAADEIVAVLLGPQWEAAVPVLQICAFFIPIDLMTSVGATMCSATGRLRVQVYIQLVTLAMLAGGLLAVAGSTIEQVAMVVAGVYWLRFIIYMAVVKSIIHTCWMDHIRLHAGHIVASGWVFACIYGVTAMLDSVPAFALLLVQVATGGIALLMFVLYGPFPYIRAGMLRLALAAKVGSDGQGVAGWFINRLSGGK